MSDAPLTRRELRELERRREKGEETPLPTLTPTVSVTSEATTTEAVREPVEAAEVEVEPESADEPGSAAEPGSADAPEAEVPVSSVPASGVALEAPLQIAGLSPATVPEPEPENDRADAPELPGTRSIAARPRRSRKPSKTAQAATTSVVS